MLARAKSLPSTFREETLINTIFTLETIILLLAAISSTLAISSLTSTSVAPLRSITMNSSEMISISSGPHCDKYNIHLGHHYPAVGPSWHSLSCPTGLLYVVAQSSRALGTPPYDITITADHHPGDTGLFYPFLVIWASGLGRRCRSSLPPPVEKTQSMSITIIHLDKST